MGEENGRAKGTEWAENTYQRPPFRKSSRDVICRPGMRLTIRPLFLDAPTSLPCTRRSWPGSRMHGNTGYSVPVPRAPRLGATGRFRRAPHQYRTRPPTHPARKRAGEERDGLLALPPPRRPHFTLCPYSTLPPLPPRKQSQTIRRFSYWPEWWFFLSFWCWWFSLCGECRRRGRQAAVVRGH